MDQSPVREVLIEEGISGWKEYEMEVMRDMDDNVVIICSIENFDPMGVHTGDSITVAPAQTLTDKEYQRMRDASLAATRRPREAQRFLPSSAAMSLVRRPTLRWAAVIWSLVTPQRFIQYSTALRSERSSRSLSMKPRLSFRPAMGVPPRCR